jgi:hypothetical protein
MGGSSAALFVFRSLRQVVGIWGSENDALRRFAAGPSKLDIGRFHKLRPNDTSSGVLSILPAW